MKIKIFVMLSLLSLGLSIKAQEVIGIPYQGTLRNTSGNYMQGVSITVKVSLIKDDPLSTASYVEKHSVITDAHGRYMVMIGEGLALQGIYENIDWGSGIYYAVIEIDVNGSGVFESLGSELFATVPYALYSKMSADGFSGDYNLLINKPILFDGEFASLTEMPNTLGGYMINNGLDTLHPAYTITAGDLIVWDSAYNRGNHAGKYKLVGYFPEWIEVTNKPNFHPVALSGDYNDLQNLPQLYDSTWNSIKGRPIGEQDGDMLYWENNSWVNLHKGTNGQKLGVASSKPAWQTSNNKVKLATLPITGLLKNLKAKGYSFCSTNGVIVSRGICWDTVDEPTLAGSYTSLAAGNGIFEVQLQGIDHFSTYYYRTFVITNTDTIYGNIENTAGTTCGSSFSKNHNPANGVAPLAKTVQYSTVAILTNGQNMCWLAQNLGATYTALAVNDSTESAAGWYFQFKRKQGYYHNGGSVRIPSGIWVNSNGATGDWAPEQDPCTCELGTNWRLPNHTEWVNYMATISWTVDWNALWASPLKLHAAGALSNSTSNLVARGATGYYGSLSNTYRLRFTNTAYFLESYPQSTAVSVRCIAP